MIIKYNVLNVPACLKVSCLSYMIQETPIKVKSLLKNYICWRV